MSEAKRRRVVGTIGLLWGALITANTVQIVPQYSALGWAAIWALDAVNVWLCLYMITWRPK